MQQIVERYGRIYSFTFLRQLKEDAIRVVEYCHKNGFYAFKKRIVDSKGVPVWGIYTCRRCR